MFLYPVTRAKGTSISATEGGVCPVRRGDGGLVLLGAGLVEHGEQLGGVVVEGLEVDHGVRPVAVVAVEDEVAVKVPGVEAGQGEAIAVTRQRGLGGGHRGSGGGGEQVVEQVVRDVSGNSASLGWTVDSTVLVTLYFYISRRIFQWKW